MTADPQMRRLSGLERVWLAADRVAPPFVNQWVLEGEGTPEPAAFEAALAAVARAHPLTAARLTGWGRSLAWRATGAAPRFRIDDDWATARLDPRRGPVAEVVWAPGARQLVFRTHHAAFDGRGATFWAEEVARALRGVPLLGPAAPADDRTPARLLKAEPGVEPPADRGAPLPPEGRDLTMRWRRLRFEGRPRGRVLPRLLQALTRRAGAPLRFSVPVDLRRHLPDARHTHNLTGVAYLDLAPEASVEAIHTQLAAAAAGPAPAGHALAAHAVRGVPVALMAAVGRRAARQHLRAGRWPVSAVVSNLGRQNLAAVAGGGFTPQRGFWVPPGSPGLPLFVTAAGDAGGVELCVAAPQALGGARLADLLADLAAAMG